MSAAPEPEREAAAVQRGLADPGVRDAVQELEHLAVLGHVPEGGIFFWNRGCERFFGHAAAEALGADPAALLDVEGELPGCGMHEFIHRDGRRCPALVYRETARSHPDRQPEIYMLVTPLSPAAADPVHFDDQLLRSQKLESLGVLAGGIAHDFNNLLLGVVGNADLVLMELDPDHPARDSVEQIAQAGLRAADLCRQLLAFSGKGKMLEEPLDLSRLVQDLAPLMHMSQGGARLRLDLAPDLPVVEADTTQMRQVIMNLVTNAAEALAEKPGLITIRTSRHDAVDEPLNDAVTGRALPLGSYVCLQVEDDGVGLPREQRDRIFEPFFTTKFMGRGLGLAAVQGIVRAHHGTVTVDSEADRGSAFAVFLPAVGLRAAHASGPEGASAPAAAASERTQDHVLVVDDEIHVREVAGNLLSAAGYEVSRAEDGDHALSLLRRDPSAVDLVLLDMTMPGLDGLEVLERVRRMRSELPVLLSSGYSREAVDDVVSADPACAFIQKPYRRKELLDATQRLLDTASGD